MLKLTDHLPMVPDIGNRLFGGSSSDQVITLGGVAPDGRSAVCDMTWIFLKAVEMLRLRDPNMNARYAPGVNSRAYLRRLCEVNVLTRATPSLHNDDAVLPALVEQGFPLEEARDWGATGCVEPTICGRHFGHTNSMMFNMVAPLEMALRDGVHPLLGQQVGPRTGDPRTFDSFDKFVEAYGTQLGWLIDRSVEINNLLGKAHQVLRPTPLLSGLIRGCLESGRDAIDGGAQYNTSGVAMVGLTDVVDSLAAIRTLVFERKSVAVTTLLEALDRDFEGHDRLLAEILHRVPRFGQDAELPRRIADDLQRLVFDRFQAHRNYRGGRYLPGYWSMSNHVAFGVLSGALPSGRRQGKAFTPGLTPSALSGAPLTDQIRAVAGLDRLRMPNNIAFNVKVVPGPHDSHAAVVDRLTAYAEAYFALGGMQMQFNVVSTATLREAMRDPEPYRDLLVRISGYNAYFVELNRDLQTELIERMEHPLDGRGG
jgi:formate C-acetyltransferase